MEIIVRKRLSILLFAIFAYFTNASCFAEQIIPTITVTPTTKTTTTKNAVNNPGTKNINNEEIQASNSQSLYTNIQGNLGAQVTDLYGDGNNASISLRGFGDNAAANTLIMIDGIPLENPDLSPIAINFIDPSTVDALQIFAGSDSVSYGDQAVGGVINIITSQPPTPMRTTTIGYGSYNSQLINTKFSSAINNNLSYALRATHYYSDNYRDHNDFQNNNLDALLNFHSINDNAYLHFWEVNKHMQLPGALTKEQEIQDPQQSAENIAYNNQDTQIIQAGYDTKISANSTLQFNTLFLEEHGDGAFTITDENNAEIPSAFTEKRHFGSFLPALTTTTNILQHTANITAGAEISDGEYNYNSDFQNSSASMLQQAAYSKINFFVTPKLAILLGGRAAAAKYNLNDIANNADQHPTNNATASTIESKYNISQTINVFIKRATSYRFPKTDEQTWIVDDKALQTQTGISYETGLQISKNKFGFILDLYQLDLKNEIMAVPDENSDFFLTYNENLDPTRRIGAIADSKIQVTPKWRIDLDASIVDAKFTSGAYTDNRIPSVPQSSLRLANNVILADNLNCYLESIYTGNKYAANDVENRAPLNAGYTIFNAGIRYVKPSYEIGIRINNLLNKHYDSYVIATYNENSVTTSYYPAATLNGMVNLTIKL